MAVNGRVEAGIRRSSDAFVAVVWPQIASWFGGGVLLPVESVTDSSFATLLDVEAGIEEESWALAPAGMTRCVCDHPMDWHGARKDGTVGCLAWGCRCDATWPAEEDDEA